GLANPGQALRDGHSTAGSPGTGLGAMQRMSAEFDLHSAPGKGLALRAVVWGGFVPPEKDGALEVGAICLPKFGEAATGDAWSTVSSAFGHVLCMADGLGHGPDAALAARAAIASVMANADHGRSVGSLVEQVHLALRPTRGAAVAVALLQPDEALCSFCGVGNISASLLSQGQSRSMVSHGGILGHQTRKVQEFRYPFPEGALCILHSDGLATRWRLDDYPGLEKSHPALIAGVLYRDYSRGHDDTAVIAVRHARGK
ncbi:MAG TPA: SpoIIE family protein phosphatase, partial [Burkholderiales bacterium]|nr:SpoIIE family protein phosphatase [Burkholderiales bacterium]